jgi:hypothetical protein
LLKQISYKEQLKREWIQEGREYKHLFQIEAAQEYQQKVEQFQEKFLLICHIVGGQPARATKLVEIRHCNIKQRGLYNIFVDCRMIAFVTTYYKNYQQTEKMKIIHWYLPQEVGELLLRYLWLVLLF